MMPNKIDLLKITEPTIASSDTDVFYIRRIGENDDGFESNEMLITIINNLNMQKTPINTKVALHGVRKGCFVDERRPVMYNNVVLSRILEGGHQIVQEYFKETHFYDVTESYLAFKFGYLNNIEQVDSLWNLAARYGYETIQDERRMYDNKSLRAFQTTGSKIVFADYLMPEEMLGRQQINFPAMKYANEDIK